MTAAIGKRIRLGRILSGEGERAACLAFDHGMQLGPIAGTADARAVVAMAVKAHLDGILLSPGLLTRCADLLTGRDRPAVILRLDQTTMWRIGTPTGYPAGHTRLVASVEEAAQMGADAVISYLFTGHAEPELETRSLEIAGRVAENCRRLGIPYVAEPMAARSGIVETPFDPAIIAMNCRIAVEIGADILKTDWPGSAGRFKPVIAACAGAPVLIAGGTREGGDADTLRTVGEILESGANGVLFGRAVFQSPDPLRLMTILRTMIHDGLPVSRACEALSV